MTGPNRRRRRLTRRAGVVPRGLTAIALFVSLIATACEEAAARATAGSSTAGDVATGAASASPSTPPAGSVVPVPGASSGGLPVLSSATPIAPTSELGYDPAKFGFAAKGLRGEVMAFVTTSQVDDALAGLDFEATSTIAFFSLVAGSTGSIAHDGRWRTWTGRQVDELIERAHASGTKVVISLARFSWSPNQTAVSTALLESAKARSQVANAIAGEVARRGVDGVNVDFEPIPRGQKANFTDLIRRIRSALDARGPGYQLTFDVVGHFESYDVAGALAPGGADAVYLMGYHYAGTFSTIAHGTAPLGGRRYSVGDAIRELREVARPEQLIVGVPYYGHLWPTVSGTLNARTRGGGEDVLYKTARLIGERHEAGYDPIEDVRWAAWRGRACTTCPLGWYQLYYDDARSLTAKWTEFRRQGLLGTGIWTTAFEGDSGALTEALRKVWLYGG